MVMSTKPSVFNAYIKPFFSRKHCLVCTLIILVFLAERSRSLSDVNNRERWCTWCLDIPAHRLFPWMESNVFWKVSSNMNITPGNRCEGEREKRQRKREKRRVGAAAWGDNVWLEIQWQRLTLFLYVSLFWLRQTVPWLITAAMLQD